MSVQANENAYCKPRAPAGPYTDEPEKPTQTVYGWEPLTTVINVIAKHGGMIAGELPQGFPYLYAAGVQDEPI